MKYKEYFINWCWSHTLSIILGAFIIFSLEQKPLVHLKGEGTSTSNKMIATARALPSNRFCIRFSMFFDVIFR